MLRRRLGVPVFCIILMSLGCGGEDEPGPGFNNTPVDEGGEPAMELPYAGGEQGNLKFALSQFDPNREAFELTGEVTVKAHFELTVAASESNPLAEITTASSSDSAHLEVEVLGPELLGITIGDAGQVSLDVVAELADGSSVEDVYTFDVVEPAAVGLSACRASGETLMFTEGVAIIEVQAEDSEGDRLASFGAPLFSMDPIDHLEVENVASHPRQLRLMAGEQPGMVTLSADYGDEELEVEIVGQGAIDEVILEDYYETTLHLDADGLTQDLAFWFFPGVEGRTPCMAAEIPYEVEVADETICEVEAESAMMQPRRGHFIGIQGRAVGTCEVTISFPSGADGQGVEKTLSVPVELAE